MATYLGNVGRGIFENCPLGHNTALELCQYSVLVPVICWQGTQSVIWNLKSRFRPIDLLFRILCTVIIRFETLYPIENSFVFSSILVFDPAFV